ncbi:MAG: hypothetical protein ACI959_001403 [Limisphaerales bacterium]|jgi:uncharacterized protein YyaL (SSP411 family)
MANRLAEETSPYLLQHANNPVDWYPWGEEALSLARKKDMPILVSIGYSACHWCHVMERESFENEEIALIMNKHFICIKVDREERPDIDHIYMSAVQTLTGQGGWPLNVFLTPEAKPFTGGTYFPPRSMYGKPSWSEVLQNIEELFRRDRAKIEEQATRLTSHVGGMSEVFSLETSNKDMILPSLYEVAYRNFDEKEGGFGGAPKFPAAMSLQFLLRYARFTKVKQLQKEEGLIAFNHVAFSIQKMIRGGIFDQIGGGFARYATDNAWLIPHFEKMLYDNALLVKLMAEHHKIKRDVEFTNAIQSTITFIQRELTHKDGGFYSALDADSEGVEGKFYVWSADQIDDLLKEDSADFKEFMLVTKEGNWEGANILNRDKSAVEFAIAKNIDPVQWAEKVKACSEILLKARASRVRPGLDDKILLSWNAMMSSALLDAYVAWGEPAWLELAKRNIAFIQEQMCDGLSIKHSWKDGRAEIPGFLEDYANFIEVLIDLYEITFDEKHLFYAAELSREVIKSFSDEKGCFFYFTHKTQNDVIVRTVELTDNATPSGNSVMAYNLIRLGKMLEDEVFTLRGERMVDALKGAIVKYTTSFGKWASLLSEIEIGNKELVIIGEAYQKMTLEAKRKFVPEMVVLAASDSDSTLNPLFEGRGEIDKTLAYLCENQSCRAPVETIAALEL